MPVQAILPQASHEAKICLIDSIGRSDFTLQYNT